MTVPTVNVVDFSQEWQGGDKPFLLDVREPNEYDTAKIEGSVLIPLGQLPGRLEEVPKDRPVVVHCLAGGRSAKAVEYLLNHGFTDVRNMEGGIRAWSLQIDHNVPQY